ncbi:MAG: DUF3887 domain-containing protein [Synechococcus sp.]
MQSATGFKLHPSLKTLAISTVIALLTALHPSTSSGQSELSPDDLDSLSPNIVERVSTLEDVATSFIDGLQAEDFEEVRELLADSIRDDWSTDDIATSWQATLDVAGNLIERGEARYEWGVNSDFVAIELAFENAQGDLLLIFDSEQKIVGLDFPPLRTESPQDIAEALVDSLAANDYVAARQDLHPVLKGELSPENIEQKWMGLQSIAGQYQERVGTQVRDTGDFQIVIVTIQFENLTDDLLVFVNNSGQISGVDFPRD